MARRPIFCVSSPLEYRVSLTRDRWREIVRHKHPALAGYERELRTCLATPTLIRESSKDPNVHLYYVPAGNAYLCVVAAPGETDERFVVTAYFTRNIKRGNALWTS